MRKLLLTITAVCGLAMIGTLPAQAFNHGCYRLGVTGYHWYRFCAGPDVMYPHHRVCHNGHCWYR
jgi:hypothetical protein